MSIGKHKIGQMFTQLRANVWGGISNSYGLNQTYRTPEVMPYNQDGITADSLPHGTPNPYRKRPVKVVYDKNDYHMFRMPSE